MKKQGKIGIMSAVVLVIFIMAAGGKLMVPNSINSTLPPPSRDIKPATANSESGSPQQPALYGNGYVVAPPTTAFVPSQHRASANSTEQPIVINPCKGLIENNFPFYLFQRFRDLSKK